MVPDNLATHPLPTGIRAAFSCPVGNAVANYTPTLDNEYVNKKYVDSRPSGGSTVYKFSYIQPINLNVAAGSGLLPSSYWSLPATWTYIDARSFYGGSQGTSPY